MNFVELYSRLHELVYDVPPEDLKRPADRAKAEKAAQKVLGALATEDEMVDYVSWAWRRESDAEDKRRDEGNANASRLCWRYLFSTSGSQYADWRVAQARGARRASRDGIDDIVDEWRVLEDMGDEPVDEPSSPVERYPHLARAAIRGFAAIEAESKRPISYVWEGIASPGQVVAIAGEPGDGKTTLVMMLFVARAGSKPVDVLGHKMRPAPPGKRLILIEEEHDSVSASKKLFKSCEIMSVDPKQVLERVMLVARKQCHVGSELWNDIVRMSGDGLADSLWVDSLARVAPQGSKANDETDQVAIFEALHVAIEACPGGEKPIAWLIAHSPKSGGSSPADAISGHHQRAAQADSILTVVASREGGRVVSTTVTFKKLREEPDPYPMPVEFSIAKKDGRFECSIHGEAPITKADVDKARAAIPLLPKKEAGTAIARRIGMGLPHFRKIVQEMGDEVEAFPRKHAGKDSTRYGRHAELSEIFEK